jgi:hypothetical protein
MIPPKKQDFRVQYADGMSDLIDLYQRPNMLGCY